MYIIRRADGGIVAIFDDMFKAKQRLYELPPGHEVIEIDEIKIDADLYHYEMDSGTIIDASVDAAWFEEEEKEEKEEGEQFPPPAL